MKELVLPAVGLLGGILVVALLSAVLMWVVDLRRKPSRASEIAVAVSAVISPLVIFVVSGLTARGGFEEAWGWAPFSVLPVVGVSLLSSLGVKLAYDHHVAKHGRVARG